MIHPTMLVPPEDAVSEEAKADRLTVAYSDLTIELEHAVTAAFNPDQPRDSDGKFAPGGGGDEITVPAESSGRLAGQAVEGGFSYQPFTDTEPKNGYMVALPGATTKVEVGQSPEATAKAIVGYLDQHQAMFTKDPNLYLGGWVHEGVLWVEPTRNVADRADAVQQGQDTDQIAVWDVANGTEIPTGGTGGAGTVATAGVLPAASELGVDDLRSETGLGARAGGRDPSPGRRGDRDTDRVVTAAFNPDQPRDDDGKFASEGGGEDKVEGLDQGRLDAMAGHLREFEQQGGRIEEPYSSEAQAESWSSRFEDQRDLMGDDDRNDSDGVKFTQIAIESPVDWEGDSTVHVAQAEGLGIAGAIDTIPMEGTYGENHDSVLHVDYLGTTGVVSGAGTALAVQVARDASAQGLAVMGEPTEDALPFWRDKMGWHEDPLSTGSDMWGWTPDEVKQVAGVRA